MFDKFAFFCFQVLKPQNVIASENRAMGGGGAKARAQMPLPVPLDNSGTGFSMVTNYLTSRTVFAAICLQKCTRKKLESKC